MRKIVLMFLFVGLCITQNQVFGAPYCPGSTISFQWLQDADDDEFMYTNMETFNEAKQYESENGGQLTKGHVYECDNEQGCAHYKYFLTTPDSVFEGEETGDMQLYECIVGGSDEWSKQTLVPCTALPASYTDHTKDIINLNGRDFIYIHDDSKVNFCYLTSAMLDCFNAKKSDPKVYWQNNECKCQESDGEKYAWNQQQKKCDPISATPVQEECPTGSSDQITKQADCRSNETFVCVENTGAECRCGKCVKNQETIDNENAAARSKKCTDSGGKWSNGECKCDAKKNLRLSNGECVCTDSNYERDGDKCVLTDAAQDKKDCEAAANTGAYWQDGECKCKNPQHDWRNKTCQLKYDIVECNKITGAHWVNNECKCINNNQEINADRKKCEMSVAFTATQTVNSAYSQLVSIHNKFRDNVSVWKDSEGKFNTARLTSDSIAGVVLGTTGALVTSHVVKKNQVENGFEDIKCTIGGQNVAEWGDQFRVGIQ